MFNFIADAFKNAFTAPGTNARKSQDRRNSQIARGGADLFEAIQPILKDSFGSLSGQRQFADSLEPGRRLAISNNIFNLANMMNNGSARASASRLGQEALYSGMDTYRNTVASNPGISESLRNALLLDAQNRRADAEGRAYGEFMDPDGQAARRQQILGALLGLYNASTASPQMNVIRDLSNLASMFGGLVYGQPQTMVQPGLGEVLGQVAGQWASTGFQTGRGGGK